MLRMGKTPKPGSVEHEAQATAPHPTYAAYQQPAYAAYPQPATPSPITYSETPARPESEIPPTTRAVAETESLARELKDGTLSGFVGGGTILKGEAVFKGMLRVDGHLLGRITSEKGTLIVSSGGRVDADINVAAAKINGVVNGDIVASERLEFGRSAQVYGDIHTPALLIEDGAIFEGSCRMSAVKAEEGKEQTEKPREKEYAGRGKVSRPIPDESATTELLESSSVTS
jgi:cytoskeletal protein CcmA (bactofilin family)